MPDDYKFSGRFQPTRILFSVDVSDSRKPCETGPMGFSSENGVVDIREASTLNVMVGNFYLLPPTRDKRACAFSRSRYSTIPVTVSAEIPATAKIRIVHNPLSMG